MVIVFVRVIKLYTITNIRKTSYKILLNSFFVSEFSSLFFYLSMKLEGLENVFSEGKEPEFRPMRDLDFPPGNVAMGPVAGNLSSGRYSIAMRSVAALFFRMPPPHRRVNGGLGGPPGITIPGTTCSHPCSSHRPYLVWYGLVLARAALIGL